MSDAISALERELVGMGYIVRTLPDGRVNAVLETLLTVALIGDLNSYTYERRYYYRKMHDALNALAAWDGNSDPPGPWIKETVHGRGAVLDGTGA